MDQDEHLTTSRTYRLMLTGSVLLFLATLTAAVLVIILSNAEERDLQQNFEATLTAIAGRTFLGQIEFVGTPEVPPEVIAGEYPFTLRAESPFFSGGTSCAEQTLTGQISDNDGTPTDAYSVLVWGDYVTPRVLLTGEIAQQPPGQWSLTVPGNINRRLWVQVMAAGRFFSEPFEVVFVADDCTRNQATLVVDQTGPLP